MSDAEIWAAAIIMSFCVSGLIFIHWFVISSRRKEIHRLEERLNFLNNHKQLMADRVEDEIIVILRDMQEHCEREYGGRLKLYISNGDVAAINHLRNELYFARTKRIDAHYRSYRREAMELDIQIFKATHRLNVLRNLQHRLE